MRCRGADRIRSAAQEDAMVNSLIILDIFAQSVDSHIQGQLAKWRRLFTGYLAPPTVSVNQAT